MSERVTVWVEVIGERGRWGSISAKPGRMWKRRPQRHQVAPGAIVVEVRLDVPEERFDHVVVAQVPAPPPLAIGSGQ